jgi:hypothetical protein
MKRIVGGKFPQKLVKISNCRDIRPNSSVVTMLPCVKNLFIEGCDKNFQFYWLNRKIWPNVKNIYFDSKLDLETDLFDSGKTKIYLNHHYFDPYEFTRLGIYKNRKPEDIVNLVDKKYIQEMWLECCEKIISE